MLIGRTIPHPLTNTQIRAMMNEVQTKEMTTSQRMEKQFFIQFIQLVNEVQGKSTLPSQYNSNRKSTWMKQIKSQRQDQSALASV